MEAKDTVMNIDQLNEIPDWDSQELNPVLKAQAEISFEAGYEQVWKDGIIQQTFDEGKKAGIKEVVELAIKAISDEPEFPGEMPDEMWDMWRKLDGDKTGTTEAIRIIVSLTKEGITNRLKKGLK